MISRRKFVQDMALAGAAGVLGFGRELLAAEPPPETNRIRLADVGGVCVAPQYVAEDLLRGEGFSDVRYLNLVDAGAPYKAFSTGEIDISMAFIAPFILQVDLGNPIVMLAGVHPGCFELFANDQVRAVRDLKGKVVSVPTVNSAHQLFIATMASHVGLDPQKDIKWMVHAPAESMRLLAEGKIDALVGFPPVPQEIRAKRIGHVVVNSLVDKPWSQYFCCIVTGNRDFVRKYPIAAKRAVRAILKAANLCAANPEQTARLLVDRKFTPNYDYALQTMRELPYARWREYDTEDSVRFYALRLRESGFIKSSPKTIIAEGTDFRFLNELKKELKA